MGNILLLENDARTSERIVEFLVDQGHSVEANVSADEALERLRKRELTVDLAIVAWDYQSDVCGPEFLSRLKQYSFSFPRLVIAPLVTLDVRNRALALGAADLLLKPIDGDRLRRAVGQVLKDPVQVDPLVAELRKQVVGESPSLLASIVQLAQGIRRRDTSILLIGESGVGKEVFARLVHQRGSPEGTPLEAVNLAGLSPTLIESELFGHEKGAFTGADRQHAGAFERAKGGTLFLDEIGYLDSTLQPRLLRAIDQRRFLRVGGNEEVEFKARLVCATSRNLADAVRSGSFRVDLYHRINSFEIRIPALRERRDDIRHLTDYLLRDTGVKVERETRQILESYSFPGNIRELDSILKHAVAASDGHCLLPANLPGEIMTDREASSLAKGEDGQAAWPESLYQASYKEASEEVQRRFDRDYFLCRLQQAGNNREMAARDMGISARTLRDKLKLCGLGHLIRGDGADSGTRGAE